MTIALWIQPRPGSPLYDSLRTLILGLQSLFPDGVTFEPHVTITSDIIVATNAEDEILQRDVDRILDGAVVATKVLNPGVSIRFNTVSFGWRYFKKVYISCEGTLGLVAFAQICRESFVCLPNAMASSSYTTPGGGRDQASYNDSPRSTASSNSNTLTNVSNVSGMENMSPKARAAEQARQWIKDYDPHLSLVYSDEYPVDDALQRTILTRIEDVLGNSIDLSDLGWNNGKISLVNCEGPVSNWEILGSRDLH